MVQNCPRCGRPNVAGHRYCSNCGAQIIISTVPASSSAPLEGASIPQGVERVPAPTNKPVQAMREVPVQGGLRGDLPPNVGERTGQATYVPYASDATRQIEKQKPNNSWLMPTIAIAGAMLLVLIGITLYLLLSKPTLTPGSQIASNQTEPLKFPIEVPLPCVRPANASVEQDVIYVVCRSSEEQAKAWRELDTEVLKQSRTGADLQENIKRVEEYRAKNQFADPVQHKLTILSLVLTSDVAKVRTSEEWSVVTYNSADKSVVERLDRTTYTEVYRLVKQGDKWLIDLVAFENLPAQTPVPTPTLRPGDGY